MSKKSAQYGTGLKTPVIQKLHSTGQKNVKIKLNRAAAKRITHGDTAFLQAFTARVRQALWS